MDYMDLSTYAGFQKSALKVTVKAVREVLQIPDKAFNIIIQQSGHHSPLHPGDEISDELLGNLSYAYVRKIRHYFVTASCNYSSLSHDDQSLFERFVKTFKKDECKEDLTFKWSSIDTTKICEFFKQEVERKSEEDRKLKIHLGVDFLTLHTRSKSILGQISLHPYIYKISLYRPLDLTDITNDGAVLNAYEKAKALEEVRNILTAIIQKGYILPFVDTHPHVCQVISNFRRVYLFARYHIHSDDKGDDICNIVA